jgi:hypothetical protein
MDPEPNFQPLPPRPVGHPLPTLASFRVGVHSTRTFFGVGVRQTIRTTPHFILCRCASSHSHASPHHHIWFLYWAPTALGPHCHGNQQRPALRPGPPYRSARPRHVPYGHVPYRLITLRAQPRLRYFQSRRTQRTGLTRTSRKTVQAPLSRECTPLLALPSARAQPARHGPNSDGAPQAAPYL